MGIRNRGLISLAFQLCFLAGAVSFVAAYSCKSPDGRDTDWFVAYKFPDLNKLPKPFSTGTAFIYADSNTPWHLSELAIDDKDSALGKTVSQLFAAKRNKEEFFAAYNDEHPDGKTDSGRGHMKGALAFDDITGFWLIHSVPKYPATMSSTYSYPKSGTVMGQSFLCITFTSSELNDIGTQLLYGQPSVYDKNVPPSFAQLYPRLAAALGLKGTKRSKSPPSTSSIRQLTSRGGQTFTSFYKSKKFGKDLYDALVAPELRSSLFVETWMNGGGNLPPDCATPYDVFNVRSVRPMNVSFESSRDHSKWAVSANADEPWICIGDINRQRSQGRRGGGTTCFVNSKIASLYKTSVVDAETCSLTDSRHRQPKSASERRGAIGLSDSECCDNDCAIYTKACQITKPMKRRRRKVKVHHTSARPLQRYRRNYGRKSIQTKPSSSLQRFRRNYGRKVMRRKQPSSLERFRRNTKKVIRRVEKYYRDLFA